MFDAESRLGRWDLWDGDGYSWLRELCLMGSVCLFAMVVGDQD